MMWIAYSVPFTLVLLAGVGFRLFAGPERTARWSGLPLGWGVLAGWVLLVDPSMVPKTAHDRVGHMVLGAIIVGVAFDTVVARPLWRGVILGLFIMGCAWLSVMGGVAVRTAPTVATGVAGAAWAATWLTTTIKMDTLRSHAATAQTIIVAALAGIVAIAMTIDDGAVAKTVLGTLSAWVGLILARFLFAAPISWAALMPVLAVIFSGAWAMAVTRPVVAPGLAVLLFVLFADRTARRIPMPGGRISDILYVLVLAGMAAIPVILAVAIVAARL